MILLTYYMHNFGGGASGNLQGVGQVDAKACAGGNHLLTVEIIAVGRQQPHIGTQKA